MKRLLFLLLLIPALIFGQVKGLTYGGKAMLYGDKAAGAGEFPPTGLGDIYYVSTSGDDAKDGLSEANAWATLAYAETNAPTGSTIALKKGDTWALDNVLEINQGGIPGDYTTWDGSLWGSGANAIIKCANDRSDPHAAIVHMSGGLQYLTFQNIKVDGDNKIVYGIVIGSITNTFSPSLVQNNENHIIIQDCAITDLGAGTVYLNGIMVQTWNNDISNITIRRNTIDRVGSHGISFYPGNSADGATEAEISDSYIGYNVINDFREYTSNVGYGIHINNKTTNTMVEYNTVGDGGGVQIALDQNEVNTGWFPTGITIRYNDLTSDIAVGWPMLFEVGQAVTCDVYGNVIKKTDGNNTGGGIWIFNHGARTSVDAELNFYFNTIYANSGIGLNCDLAEAGIVTWQNNLIFDGSGFCMDLLTAGVVVHSYNCYYSDYPGDPYLVYGAEQIKVSEIGGWEATAIATDPTFTVEFTNLHLQTGSPAIDAGVAIEGITEDIEGNPMQDYIGAYQTIQDP